MLLVRIRPKGKPSVLADFLRKHGFNVGELKNGAFECLLSEEGKGNIDTRFYLARLADAAKIHVDYEFTVEGTTNEHLP